MDEKVEKLFEKEITCPYCGFECGDSWEYGLDSDGDTKEEECEKCNKKFHIQLNVEATYTTRGLCNENNMKHNWKEFSHETDGKTCSGKECLTCDELEFDKTPEPSKLIDKDSSGEKLKAKSKVGK